jgi:hypothetical protein
MNLMYSYSLEYTVEDPFRVLMPLWSPVGDSLNTEDAQYDRDETIQDFIIFIVKVEHTLSMVVAVYLARVPIIIGLLVKISENSTKRPAYFRFCGNPF